MKHRLQNAIIVVLLIFSVGGQWAFLQSVAWVGMLAKYSQQDSFSVALSKTFDGKHPCKLCKAVQAGKQSEQKRTLLKTEVKLDYLLAQKTQLFFPPNPFSLSPSNPDRADIRAESPPTPPPRLA